MHKSALALVIATFVTACQSDASMSKDIVGTWTWKPRDELPKDQIKDTGFPTPSFEAVKFTADGRYVFVQRIPGYDTDVAGKPIPVPEEWHEWKGPWEITKGALDMRQGSTEDRWLAKLRENGWVTESEPVSWERSFEIVELESHKLKLKTKALNDFDRTFHKGSAMPERPALGPR